MAAPGPIPHLPIASQTFSPTPGLSSFFNATLLGVTVLGVKREGLGFRVVTGSPSNSEVRYSAGYLYFEANMIFNPGEKIWVIYKT